MPVLCAVCKGREPLGAGFIVSANGAETGTGKPCHGLRVRSGAGDPFDFAQGRLFAPPEERLRSGWRRRDSPSAL